jgi:ATP-dependent DNA helicase RecQ
VTLHYRPEDLGLARFFASRRTDAPGLRAVAPGFPPQQPVRHREWGPGVVVASAPDRVTVLFDRVGYKTLSLAAVTDQHLLDPPPAVVEQGHLWPGVT